MKNELGTSTASARELEDRGRGVHEDTDGKHSPDSQKSSDEKG